MKLRPLLWLALFLIGAGYFGPWVWHKAAGLNLSADDLGEWIKFLPAWKSGQLSVTRELFYLPIWLTSIGLGLMAGRIKAWPWKLVALAVSLVLVLTPLPKYPELLSAYREPEFRLTFWATMAALLLSVAFTFLGAQLPDRVEAILWIMIGVSAALFAPWMFGRALPDIDRLYHYTIGWGIVAEVIGGVLLALVGGVLLFAQKPPRR
jgi:hydrogenase/urease accessory protein HupE